eukprot:1160285-Pelagomonas_calceolata.AAC.6
MDVEGQGLLRSKVGQAGKFLENCTQTTSIELLAVIVLQKAIPLNLNGNQEPGIVKAYVPRKPMLFAFEFNLSKAQLQNAVFTDMYRCKMLFN